MKLLGPEIVAYKERPSWCGETGEEGTLRDEWRLVARDWQDAWLQARLNDALGEDWEVASPHEPVILEHRYIRRGVEEPWKPFDLFCDEIRALEAIDFCAVPIDLRLAEIRAYDEEERRESAKQDAINKAEHERKVEEARKQREGQEAFGRLLESKQSEWAAKWSAWVESVDAAERDRLATDERFMALYNAAMLSNTVPSKRKAIKEVLAYVGYK